MEAPGDGFGEACHNIGILGYFGGFVKKCVGGKADVCWQVLGGRLWGLDIGSGDDPERTTYRSQLALVIDLKVEVGVNS